MSSIDLLAMWTPSFWELMIIMVIALLLFGKRLPEVARSLGKGVVEFKKGLKGVEDETDGSSQYTPPRVQERPYTEEKTASTAPSYGDSTTPKP